MNNGETLENKEKIESDEKITKQNNEGMSWSTQQVILLYKFLFKTFLLIINLTRTI